jgi:hypothetical protein
MPNKRVGLDQGSFNRVASAHDATQLHEVIGAKTSPFDVAGVSPTGTRSGVAGEKMPLPRSSYEGQPITQYDKDATQVQAGVTNTTKAMGMLEPVTSTQRIDQVSNRYARMRVESPEVQKDINASATPYMKREDEEKVTDKDKENAGIAVGLDMSQGGFPWYRQ